MALKVNNKNKPQFVESKKPVDFEVVTISKWRYKDYKLNEVVYNVTKTGLSIYKCIKEHEAKVYIKSNGLFSETIENTKYWSGIDESTDNNVGAVSDFYLSGTTVTLELSNGTKYDVKLDDLSTYVTSGNTSGSDLLLYNVDGSTIATIDLSQLTGINTFVQSGQIVGSNMVLSLNDGSTVTIDVTSLITDNNTYLSSGVVSANNLELTLNNGDTISVDLSSIVFSDFTSLNDTPNSYVGQENNLLGVKSDGSGLEFKTVTTSNGYTKHKYITIEESDFTLNNGLGLYEYTLSSSELDAKEIVVHLTVSGVSMFNNYVINLPTILSSTNLAKKITFICKDFDQSDMDYGLFIKTPWLNNGNSNRILGPQLDCAVSGLGYWLPLERYEVVEMLFDGSDWLCLNKSFNEYVSAKPVNYFTTNPPGNNNGYINR